MDMKQNIIRLKDIPHRPRHFRSSLDFLVSIREMVLSAELSYAIYGDESALVVLRTLRELYEDMAQRQRRHTKRKPPRSANPVIIRSDEEFETALKVLF